MENSEDVAKKGIEASYRRVFEKPWRETILAQSYNAYLSIRSSSYWSQTRQKYGYCQSQSLKL